MASCPLSVATRLGCNFCFTLAIALSARMERMTVIPRVPERTWIVVNRRDTSVFSVRTPKPMERPDWTAGRDERGQEEEEENENKSKEQKNEREMDRDEQKVNQRKTGTYRSKKIPTKSSHCVVSRSKSQWTTRVE